MLLLAVIDKLSGEANVDYCTLPRTEILFFVCSKTLKCKVSFFTAILQTVSKVVLFCCNMFSYSKSVKYEISMGLNFKFEKFLCWTSSIFHCTIKPNQVDIDSYGMVL